MTSGMDPYVIRDFAQDMSRAVATAGATISQQADMINRVRELHYEYLYECMACNDPFPCATIKALNPDTLGASNE